MILRVAAVVLGVLCVTAGLVLGPAPWLALIFVGLVAAAFGLFVE